MTALDCPFCSIAAERVVFSGDQGQGIWDAFPVNPGHLLLIPRRHVRVWMN
jgi:diadenosine tetraphosphate (Ap4A) HIT family hydrolase